MTNYKKVIFTIFLTIFSFSGLLTPKSANAFSPGVVAVNSAKWVWQKVEQVYNKVQGIVGSELSNRTVGMFLDSVAYDVATQLAEGGPGGKPQFRTISIKKTLDNANKKALGEFLGELTDKGFDELGINLCDPSLELKRTLVLGLLDEELPPQTSRACSWNQLKKNWSQFGDDVQADIIKFQLNPTRSGVTSTIDFFRNLASRKTSDLGIAFVLGDELNRRKLEAEEVLKIEAIECQGYIDDKTPITDEVITHCSVNKGMSENLFTSATEIEAKKQTDKKKAADAVPLSAILKDAGNKFLNTFTSKLMKNWIQKGMWSLFGSADNDIYANSREGLIDRLRGGANIRQPRGADIFKEIKTVNIEGLESFDYISDFTICPDQFRGPDNCVMSPAFLQAINNKLTISQAIEQGVIDGDMPFIDKNDAINHTVNKCYRDGLCYSNLVKLRKANIVPVGWELAASRAPVSLQQAIDCFEDTDNKCSFEINESPDNEFMVDGSFHNPFYHLVDPNWVMKAPDVRCDAYGYSNILESPDSSNRQQYCADPKVCLREDSEGNCLEDQFSYCTRSENIWNFNGDACSAGELYSGCLNFSNKDFGNASYIQDTLDYCNANQAGCRRYSQYKDGENNWILEDIAIDSNDLFLNNQAVECIESDAGCNEYIVLAPDTGANLLVNGSFTDDNIINTTGATGSDGIPDGWSSDGMAYYPDEGIIENGYHWAAANNTTAPPASANAEEVIQKIILQPNTSYRMSASAAQVLNTNSYTARMAIIPTLENAILEVNGGDCEIVLNGTSPTYAHMRWVPSGTEMERASCTFTTGNTVSLARVYVLSNPSTPVADNLSSVFLDDVKLEVISNPNEVVNASYSDYGEGAKIYMDASTVMCIADEVGCQGYNPDNGDPMIPAVITQDDLCPAECINYDTFTEQIDDFDIIEGDMDVEYYNFIPDTARQCPDQEIGCEEFTNLDVVAQGGEGREYFTYLRQCVGEDLGKVYYTWEGTEVSGYQIKTWYTLASNEGNPAALVEPDAPCTNMAPEGSDCLDVNFSDDNIIQINEIAACDQDTADPSDDIENNSNCREFFDVDGNVYYRLQDRVIFATNNCHDYRRTETSQIYKAVPEESVHCADANNGCKAYYGNNANNLRILFNDNFEQGSYEPWVDSAGGPLDLSNVALQNNGHSLITTVDKDFVRHTINSPLKVGKTYKISWWMMSSVFLDGIDMDMYVTDGPNADAPSIMRAIDDSSFANIEPGRWHQYTISTTIAPFSNNVDEDNLTAMNLRLWLDAILDQEVYIDNFTIKEVENSFAVVRNSWSTPISCDDPYEGYYLGCQAYSDLNGQDFNLKSFDHLCREEAIGCLPVIDTKNSNNPFAETFRPSYCSDPTFTTAATCLAPNVWTEEYAETTVEADSFTYLVPDPNNYCPQSAKGCTEVGTPDRLDETKFSTVYKLNDPDKYNSILCSSEGLNCAEYNTPKGNFYFKDPGLDTCTYQQNTLIENNLLSGWFKTSTLGDSTPLGCADTDNNPDSDGDGIYDVNELILPRDYCSIAETNPIPMPFFTRDDCESTSVCIENTTQNQVAVDQADCEANALYTWSNLHWNDYLIAAQCPVTENLCTSFKDPVDPIDCDPKGRNIDFIDYKGFCFDGTAVTLDDNQKDCKKNNNSWILPSKDGYCDSNIYNNQKDCETFGHIWTAYCQDYYYYDNNKIDSSSCNGLVNRQDGCALFYDANDWDAEHNQVTTIYDTNETYENIEVLNLPASPVACNSDYNPACELSSNRLIKVNKDRQCAEWLACKSSSASYDIKTEDYKIICDELASCIDFQYDPDSNTTKCKKWGSFDKNDEALTIQKYQSRDTGFRNHISWSDKEYIGYSIPNLLPIGKVNVLDFGEDSDELSRLIYNMTDSADTNGAYFDDCVEFDVNGVRTPLNGKSCTATINTDGDYYFKGECKENICWLNPKVNETSTTTYALETRVYAVADAPFPAAIETNIKEGSANYKERLAKYKGANICKNDPVNDNFCELSYKQIKYGRSGQEVLFFPEKAEKNNPIPSGICTTGEKLDLDGNFPKECKENYNCDSKDSDGISRGDGFCSLRTEEINFKNWPGICLEYDYDIPITRDGENSYYCNQWYPVQKIKGTSSLYDNYREAGYFEPNGRDALFCAVAEPYALSEDRYYCAAVVNLNSIEYCSVLALVPAGTKINLDEMVTYGDAILYGYLDKNLMTTHDPEDIIVDEREGVTFNGLGVNWLNRNNAGALWTGGNPAGNHRDPLPASAGAKAIEGGSSLFFPKDFDSTKALGLDVFDAMPVLPISSLDSIFDTSVGGLVKLYYYDSKINKDGQRAYQAGVVWPWYLDEVTKEMAPRGLYQIYGVQKTEDHWVGDGLNQCKSGYHESWFNQYLDGNYESKLPGFDQRGWTGHKKKEQSRWCSPLSYGYYIQPVFPNAQTVNVCQDTYCDEAPSCLLKLPAYNSIATPVDCGGDPNCEYKKCVEDIVTDSHQPIATTPAHCAPVGPYPKCNTISSQTQCGWTPHCTWVPEVTNGVTWCSDYGTILGNTKRVEYTCDDFSLKHYADFEDITSISSCYDKLYYTVDTSISTSRDFDGVACQTSSGQSYQSLTLRAGVDNNLIEGLLGTDTTYGCLAPEAAAAPNPEGTNCSPQAVNSWFDLSKGIKVSKHRSYLDATQRYYSGIAGTPCTGLDCYQQCRIVTDLDSEGNLSAVRTDIWWRNKEATGKSYSRIGKIPWQSYYWSPAGGYISSTGPATDDDDVLYGSISGFREEDGAIPAKFSHFGAGLGVFDLDKLLTVRVPYYKDDLNDNPTAVTFFAALEPPLSLADTLADALTEMQNLFYKVYNLEWVNDKYESPSTASLGSGNNNNPFADIEYNPRILAVCGESLCETSLDVDNNVTAVTEGITVNGITTGTLQGQDSSLFVNVKFFYYAHPDHMPVYSVNVAWGDNALNDSALNVGKYTNSLPDKYCDPEASAPGPVMRDDQKMGFGGTKEACRAAYKVFYHDYLYDTTGQHNCDGTNGSPVIFKASCYQPKARVYDNWGQLTEQPFDGWIVVHES